MSLLKAIGEEENNDLEERLLTILIGNNCSLYILNPESFFIHDPYTTTNSGSYFFSQKKLYRYNYSLEQDAFIRINLNPQNLEKALKIHSEDYNSYKA